MLVKQIRSTKTSFRRCAILPNHHNSSSGPKIPSHSYHAQRSRKK